MSDVKSIVKNMFIYKPHKEHDFVLPEKKDKSVWPNYAKPAKSVQPKTPISTSLEENLEFLKVKYNSMINSDIIMREIDITIKGKKHKALIVRNRWNDEHGPC